MPRNGSGTMSIPTSFSSGTTISSSSVNGNFSDVAAEITNSLPRDGQAAMTAPLRAASGTAAAPGVTFSSDTDTGFYRSASGQIGMASDGVGVGNLWPIPTGAVMDYMGTTAPAGWVFLNGRTIGNASSGATGRANADTEALFTLLWNGTTNTNCPVSSGRGSSAAADFAAGKTLTLPSARGRARFGVDDMGNASAGVLGAIITNDTELAATGGSETVTLTASQMPVHTHGAGTLGGNTNPILDHTHTYTVTNSQNQQVALGSGASVNSGTTGASTSAAGNHQHTLTITGATDSAGSGAAHSNMPPALLTYVIIKL